jgi:hemerythrin-like metal-binding protein
MPHLSDFNAAASAQTDREHTVQLSLLQALCEAVSEQRDPASVAQLLDQLSSYCEAHFMSEELLMRQKSYDDYEDHVDDHSHMMEALSAIATEHASGNAPLVASKTQEVLAFIRQHIATRDQRFADFLRSGQ